MTEAVYNVDAVSTLNSLAQTMGFWDAATQSIRATGPVAGSPDGEYFINHIGVVYQPTGATTTTSYGATIRAMAPLSGEWGRLRINGTSTFIQSLKTVVTQTHANITIYELVQSSGGAFWSSDGVNPAPAYVASIGVIA